MADEFIESLERLNERIEQENRVVIGAYTGRQLMMIASMMEFDEPPTLAMVAEKSRCSHQNIRTLISIMEDQGCLVVRKSEKDNRSLRIEFTPKGRMIGEKICRHLERARKRYNDKISPEDRATFARVVDVLVSDPGYIMDYPVEG